MLEGVKLGFDEKSHMVFSACRDCAYFRAICLDGNHGFCCSEGKAEDNFLPFEYPMLGKEGRQEAIGLYQGNELPEECRFHTQCAMLNFMEDESVADGIASENVSVVGIGMEDVNLDEPVFKDAVDRDPGLADWCKSHPDADAFLLKKDDAAVGFVFLASEQDADYSWIQPAPPDRHYLQKGSKVVGIRLLHVKDGDAFGAKLLLGMAYAKALGEDASDFYAIAYNDVHGILSNGGFRGVGYFLGGNGSDGDAGAVVMVKKVRDLEDGR